MSRIFISAAHKSSGKTTISIGLCRALSMQGLNIQPFKKGPDYIDPMWLSAAAKNYCHNLDFYTMQDQEILDLYSAYNSTADLSLIEGNKGLYDGLDLDGSNSNAALAKLLSAPIVLVIDARGMTRGIAPLILGYQAFDHEVNISGVILNQLGGFRHESKLRAVIEHYTDIPVIGAVHRNTNIEIKERHLGLMPSNESEIANQQIDSVAKQISDQVDLAQIVRIADTADSTPEQKLAAPESITTGMHKRTYPVKLGIAMDTAFGFYYPDDINEFEKLGVEIIQIDTLHDAQLPDIDGLFIGGGFPETQMAALEENASMRESIKQHIENGLPCYAECGGLMYLAESINWRDKTHKMVGVIPGKIKMHEKPQGRGYIRIMHTGNELWNVSKNEIFAHEFHYSSLEGLSKQPRFAYNVKRGMGVNGHNDGIIIHNTLACYAHLKNTQQSPWIESFVKFIEQHKQKGMK